MFWVILGFLIVAGSIIVVAVSLSEVGNEPGAHRFGEYLAKMNVGDKPDTSGSA